MHLILSVVSYAVFAALAPFLLFHPKLRAGRQERFGRYSPEFAGSQQAAPIWLHGASAGDILALLPTARVLKTLLPHVPIVASTLTNSGYAMAKRQAGAFDRVIYSPWDLPHVTRRALRRVAPKVLVVEYTELWPQLLQAANKARVPVLLHNGRFGKARLGRYKLLFALTGNLLHKLSLLLMRDEHERERALALGARPDNTRVTGNTKFDNVAEAPCPAALAALRLASGFAANALVWVAGSTHEGEEEALLRVFVALRRQLPSLRLVLAPRYAERALRVMALVHKAGLRGRLRESPRHAGGPQAPSEGLAQHEQGAADPEVFVLNSVGELRGAYALATAVFVGGSFVARGGQNILEPAACGKPVLFGPHMDNFTDSVAVLLGRGGVQVANYAQLERVLRDWLQDPQRCAQLGLLAQRQLGSVRGAAARNAAHICAAYAQR